LLRFNKKTKNDKHDISEVNIPANLTKDSGLNFVITDKLILANIGETHLRCWFAPEQNASITNKFFEIKPGTEIKIDISNYAIPTDNFFIIQNLSHSEEGILEIEKI
jgi:hypothetical protein